MHIFFFTTKTENQIESYILRKEIIEKYCLYHLGLRERLVYHGQWFADIDNFYDINLNL